MIDSDRLKSSLASSPNNWEVVCVDSIDSTNGELMRRFAKATSVPFMILWAGEQTEGRGRLSRQWLSVPNRDITASVCFPSPVASADTPKLNIIAGITLTHVLRHQYDIPAMTKWPNDVVTKKGKIAGILSNYLANSHGIICGIGINVNSDPGEISLDPQRPRTTVRAELNRDISLERLFIEWLLAFEKMWHLASSDRISDLKDAFKAVDFYANRKVRVFVNAASDRDSPYSQNIIEGIASGLDSSGALKIVLPSGQIYCATVDDSIFLL